MTDALLAADANQTTDATTTTQDGTANVGQAPAPEQQAQQADTPPTGETETPQSKTKPTEGEAKTEAQPKAPELYEFDVPEGMPEGFEKDEAVFDALAEASREIDLTQEQAQGLVDKVLPVMHRRQVEQQAALHEQWMADTKADQDIGGTKLAENLAIAKQAVKAYGNDALQELLNSPFGSHPEVVRFLVKVGKTLSEDTFVGGTRGGESVDLNDDAAIARVMYPNTPAE